MKSIIGRASSTITFLLILISSLVFPVASQEMSTPTSLSLIIYPDGVVYVSYSLDVDLNQPTINVTLFGLQYENIIVIDENATFLHHVLDAPTLSIHSLGSSNVTIQWISLDLTNKTSGIWTLAIDAPITFTVTFPPNTTILDLSEIPLEIKIENQQTILTMPANLQSISYTVGAVTPKEDAREILDWVTHLIENINAQGVETGEAEIILQQAEHAFTLGNYTGAIELAFEALDLAYTLEATQSQLIYPIIVVIGVVMIGLIVIYLRKLRVKKIDVEAIFLEYPWLREDQKEVVRFLAERRHGVFEAELRETFGIPKSSMWRLIKRLEEEEILTVEQLRGQNYIKLK